MALNFKAIDVPKLNISGRAPRTLPDEIVGVIDALIAKKDDKDKDGNPVGLGHAASAVVVKLDDAKALTNDLREAGRRRGVSVRIKANEREDGKTVTVEFWPVTAISRPRKDVTTAPAE